jgi:hypothetical protein
MESKNMVSARVELNDYANKVLGIIKIKYGLRDKSEALNKFIELYGHDVMEREATDEYVKKIIEASKNHSKKYGEKKMTLAELDNLCDHV